MTATGLTWRRALRRGGGAGGVVIVVFAGLLAATGWLYVLRGLHWFGGGPSVSDALPLLQLAGNDGQPVLRVVVAWLLGGAVTGVALAALTPGRRVVVALALGLVLLLVGSQAAAALTRNLPFWHVLTFGSPGPGPALEALAFAAGCGLPGSGAGRRLRARWSAFSQRRRLSG